jgi:Holliday junction resolvase RusA-like endonuclease
MNKAFLTIPFPPTLNHNIGRRGGRYFQSGEYKSFLSQVGWLWLKAVPRDWNKESRYSVVVELIYNTRRRYDVDNRVKPILDALTRAGTWNDDAQVDEIHVVRGEVDKERPRALVWIEPLKPRGALTRFFDWLRWTNVEEEKEDS